MTPERWQQIDQLFHAALACTGDQRASFLATECAGDESLRREVESLLSALEEDADFIETPAGDVAAELLESHQSSFETGHHIENYRIIRLLGSGGMGEVYLAEDVRLKRKVALKLLPPHFTVNPDRVRRFEREARAASALNHPNIVTIYEIGKSQSTHFIATEYVDGKTLRQLMAEKPLKLGETLNVAIQVAGALVGAHDAGIIHRDIKPENIMIRSDGYAKILDFGLAKLTEQQVSEIDTETPTLLQSNPGLVMGTVQYMSPEQARGKHVDARTDIWSLGIVMYELLEGQVPFTGETPSHVMVSLMEDELPPLSEYANVPIELDRIVARTLCKKPNERYPTANQLAHDLKSLKRQLQLEAHLQKSLETVPVIHTGAGANSIRTRAVPSGRKSSIPTMSLPATRATMGAAHQTVASSRKALGAALAICVVIAVGALGWYGFVRRNRLAPKIAGRFQNVELNRLTNSGKVTDAAISHDGTHLAFVAENEGKQSIWISELDGSLRSEIVPPEQTTYYGSTFSRDGEHLYYTALAHNNTIGVLYRVSVHGGFPEKVIHDVDGPIALSPDGLQIAFVRGSSMGERSVMIAGVDGLNQRKLVSRMGYEAFSFNGPAWSPDGTSIVCGAASGDQNGRFLQIVAVSVADGTVRPLSAEKWKSVGRIGWLHDGSGVVFSANKLTTPSTFQLWFLPYPNGAAERITRDLQDYHGVSIAGDSTTLVAKQTQTISNLWIAPKYDADLAKPILSQKADDAYDPFYYSRTRFSWTPEGQIIYTSLVNGSPNIWTMTVQGIGNKQLTNDPAENTFPSISPDSRHVIFLSNRTGFMNVWRMDADGANQTRLTSGEDDSWAWCSPDGRWIVFHAGRQGMRTVWRVPTEGGTPEQLTDYPSVCPVVSPDGKWIVLYYRLETKAPWKLGIVPFDGGRPVKSFDVPADVEFRSLVRWTPDGLSLAYIVNREGISNIWTQPLDGATPRQLTNFKADQIFWFDWSPDGQELGVSRGTVTSDVVLVRDLSKN